jgi:hypothetical protein
VRRVVPERLGVQAFGQRDSGDVLEFVPHNRLGEGAVQVVGGEQRLGLDRHRLGHDPDRLAVGVRTTPVDQRLPMTLAPHRRVHQAGGDDASGRVATHRSRGDDLAGLVAAGDAFTLQEQRLDGLVGAQLRQPAVGLQTLLGQGNDLAQIVARERAPLQC